MTTTDRDFRKVFLDYPSQLRDGRLKRDLEGRWFYWADRVVDTLEFQVQFQEPGDPDHSTDCILHVEKDMSGMPILFAGVTFVYSGSNSPLRKGQLNLPLGSNHDYVECQTLPGFGTALTAEMIIKGIYELLNLKSVDRE